MLRDYKNSLLATELRILAEDDTHATIAVRVSKEIVERNLPFLAALSELRPLRLAAAASSSAFTAAAAVPKLHMVEAVLWLVSHPVSIAINWLIDLEQICRPLI